MKKWYPKIRYFIEIFPLQSQQQIQRKEWFSHFSGGELWKSKWIIQSYNANYDYTQVDLIGILSKLSDHYANLLLLL